MSNLHCGGYFPGPTQSVTRLLSQPSALHGLCYSAISEDKESFHFMRTFVFHSLSDGADQDLWVRDAARAAQTFPVVWYAGLAMTEAYRSVGDATMANDRRRRHRLRAMEQYGRCLREIISIISQPHIRLADKEAILLSTMLLIGFCCLQDDVKLRITHIQNGLRIFNQWRFWENLESSPDRDALADTKSLIRIFRRFQLYSYASRTWSAGDHGHIREATAALSRSTLASINETYDRFLRLSHHLFAAIPATLATGRPSDPALSENAHLAHALFAVWKAKLADFLHSHHGPDDERLLTVHIWTIAIETLLPSRRVEGYDSQLMCDLWEREYGMFVDLAERLYVVMAQNLVAAPPRSARVPQPFSFGRSAGDAVGTVIMGCHDGALRRRAVALLRKWPPEYCIAPPAFAAAVVEAMMLVEEEGFLLEGADRPEGCLCASPRYICVMHRVVRYHFEPTGPSSGTMLLLLPASAREREPGIERKLEIRW